MTNSSTQSDNNTLIVDVLIVGLGPVGVALANLLGRLNVKALAIDASTEIYDKPRAISLDNEALRILQAAGVGDGELDMVAVPQVQYYSPIFGRFARMNTSGVVDTHPAVICFYQPDLEKLLRKKLEQYSCIQTMLGVRLESFTQQDSSVHAKLSRLDGSTLQVNCRYIVGGDGASSKVRQILGIPFEGKSFQQDWLIVDARNVPDPIDHVEFMCNPKRPGPRLAAPNGRQRWEFMLQPHETKEEMEKPETIRRLLAPWCDSAQIEIERTAVYRFHARVAQEFSKGRAFLVGDAAHVTPPFAGQGLVSGLRDASNLAWKLSWVLQGKAHENILNSYNAERRPHAKKIINLALFLGKLIMPKNMLMAFVIHGLMKATRWIPGCRSLFEEMKIKPENTFNSGMFLRVRGRNRLRAGSTISQIRGHYMGSAPAQRSDDPIGTNLVLIGIDADPTLHLSTQSAEKWRKLGGEIWHWHRVGNTSQSPTFISKRFAISGDAFGKKIPPNGWLAVVRPDRCILVEGPVEMVNQMIDEAFSLLAEPTASAAQVLTLVSTPT
jgi:3-(3-hydroxy-phenyl)propionate hydroxylase